MRDERNQIPFTVHCLTVTPSSHPTANAGPVRASNSNVPPRNEMILLGRAR